MFSTESPVEGAEPVRGRYRFGVARRLEIELTSDRGDGNWTWRAAGAKQPKGVLDGSLLPSGAGVGDVLKVEANADLDGLEITTVFPPKGPRAEAERIEIVGSGGNEPLVTQVLAGKGRRPRNDRRDGRRGRDGRRDGERRRDGDGQRRDQRSNRRSENRDGRRSDRRERPKGPSRPKAPRLRPRRTHRQAALAALPALQRPLAEEVLRGGVPGLRQAIDRMNTLATAEGMPKINREPLVALAEKLSPTLKAAEWRDRAEAAVAGLDTVDIRDIRSVVVAAETGAKDDEARALAERLRDGLNLRVEAEHRKWLDELAAAIGEGRTVRALRLSSRPPKAGAPLPPDMAARLAASASEALTADAGSDRWSTVIDAVAYSPVRTQVTAQGVPDKPSEELLKAVKRLASRVPQLAAAFGVDAPAGSSGRRTTPPPPPAPEPHPPAAEIPVAAAEEEE